ncbi:hypothetical protein F5877DRAFT_68364 [Lentinula edodes]|nr:hypothetical protein F5877DRAFT_68364 [Lentinula edodes]
MGVELGEYAGGSSKFEESQSMFTWPKKDNRVIRSMTTSHNVAVDDISNSITATASFTFTYALISHRRPHHGTPGHMRHTSEGGPEDVASAVLGDTGKILGAKGSKVITETKFEWREELDRSSKAGVPDTDDDILAATEFDSVGLPDLIMTRGRTRERRSDWWRERKYIHGTSKCGGNQQQNGGYPSATGTSERILITVVDIAFMSHEVRGQYQNKTNRFSEAQQDESDNLNDRGCIPKAPGSNAHRFFAFRAFATSLEGFNDVSKSTACTCYRDSAILQIAVDMTILTGAFVCTSIIWLIISVVGELVAALLIVYYFYTAYLV